MYKWQKLDAIFWEVTNTLTKKKVIVRPDDFQTRASLFFQIYVRTV